jgi:hypothetical protein
MHIYYAGCTNGLQSTMHGHALMTLHAEGAFALGRHIKMTSVQLCVSGPSTVAHCGARCATHSIVFLVFLPAGRFSTAGSLIVEGLIWVWRVQQMSTYTVGRSISSISKDSACVCTVRHLAGLPSVSSLPLSFFECQSLLCLCCRCGST